MIVALMYLCVLSEFIEHVQFVIMFILCIFLLFSNGYHATACVLCIVHACVYWIY